MNYTKTLTFILCMLIGMSVYGQNYKSKIKVRKEVKKEIIAFKIDVSIIYPQTMEPREVSDRYSLSISNDILNCNLPYIGKITSLSYGNSSKDKTIIVKDQKIKISESKYSVKNGYTLDFRCIDNSTDIVWNISVQIYKGGHGIITCHAVSRDSISYTGDVSYDEEPF